VPTDTQEEKDLVVAYVAEAMWSLCE